MDSLCPQPFRRHVIATVSPWRPSDSTTRSSFHCICNVSSGRLPIPNTGRASRISATGGVRRASTGMGTPGRPTALPTSSLHLSDPSQASYDEGSGLSSDTLLARADVAQSSVGVDGSRDEFEGTPRADMGRDTEIESSVEAVMPGSEHVTARDDGPVMARHYLRETVRESVLLGRTRAVGESAGSRAAVQLVPEYIWSGKIIHLRSSQWRLSM